MGLPTAAFAPFLLLRKASFWDCTKGMALPRQIKTKTNGLTTCYTCAVSALVGFWFSYIPVGWQIGFIIHTNSVERGTQWVTTGTLGPDVNVIISLETFAIDGGGGRFDSSLTCCCSATISHPRMPTPHGRVQTNSSHALTHQTTQMLHFQKPCVSSRRVE